MKATLRENAFRAVNTGFLLAIAALCLFPILNILAQSLSSVGAVAGGKVWLWPVGFNPEGWKYILLRTSFLNALKNSLFLTTAGTLIAIFTTTLTAYSLSKRHLKGRKFFAYLYVFFMIFSAGIVPHYFQIKSYGLINTLWALILPSVINPYYMFVLKTSLEHMPEGLEEAAKMDGASQTRILLSVVLPLSMASIATIVVFFSVNYWNKYFDALLYITKSELKPVTLFLYELIKQSSMPEGLGEVELAATVSPEIMRASAVILTILPILAVYPFMQRHFVKGVMVGSVKG
jgi:putative aldouronate transport system permease protein